MDSTDGFNMVYKTNIHLLLVSHIPYNFLFFYFSFLTTWADRGMAGTVLDLIVENGRGNE